ncbi:MAG: epimerase [Pseudomonadota bacterium]
MTTSAGKTLAIAGFGDLGERLLTQFDPQIWKVVGLRRNAHAVPSPAEGIAVDFGRPETLEVLSTLKPDALVVTLSPSDRSEDGYRCGFTDAMDAILAGLGEHRPRRAFFVSSTRVYGEQQGNWVGEDSNLSESDPRSKAILDAERLLLETIPGSCVLRAGGLYGNEPGYLIRRVRGGDFTPERPIRFGNRIHRDDLAAFIAYATAVGVEPRVISLVDDDPAPIQEVEAWLAQALGIAYEPPAPAADSAPVSHKRISNRLLHSTGFSPRFPSFREGYQEAVRRALADG